ncbi:MAG: AMP-binding protein, partial [Sulfurospirillaceae bacterium]|nr:AMP-binding protein [Sulfurospirillaceae bacterium]
MRREENTLFHMFLKTYKLYQERTALIYRVLDQEFKITYTKLFDDVLVLSRAFKAKRIEKGSKVMFLCDNRYEWMVTDLALTSLGAISIPRGADTPTLELEYIIKHSGAQFLIVENEALHIRHEEMLNTLSLKAIFIVEAPKVHS